MVIRAAVWSDLDAVVALAGSRDRAQVRLQAAERGSDSMLVAVLPSGPVVGMACSLCSRSRRRTFANVSYVCANVVG